MGEYDCYCALCCGPLRRPDIGSSCKSALQYRDWRLQRRLNAQRAGDVYESDDDAYDEYLEGGGGGSSGGGGDGLSDDMQGTEGSEAEESEESEMSEEAEAEEWWIDEEKQTYDPRIVSEESLEWVMRVRGLGYNLNAHGAGRAYFTGPCEFDDANVIRVGRGDDPDQPGDMEDMEEVDCYQEGRITDTCVYPFHESCFQILLSVLTVSDDANRIEKDVLWSTFRIMALKNCLGMVDYGAISGDDQCWESIAGEEFSVADPMHIPLLKNKEAVKAMITENRLVYVLDLGLDLGQDESTLLSPRRGASPGCCDPFGRLSTEILWTVAFHLPVGTITSLVTASPFFRKATRGNTFWKGYFRREMAWAWDVLAAVMAQTEPTKIDYGRLCLWLDRMATPKFGARGPFLGLANRRRIWSVCQKVANQYLHYMINNVREAPHISIIEQSECQEMPFVNLPRAGDQLTTTQRSLWVYGWGEIEGRQSTVELIWDENGALVGLGVTIGSARRILGMDDANNPKLRKTAGLIHPENGWIRGLIIHSKTLILGKDDTTTAISGITVLQDVGKEIVLGTPSKHSNRRYLIPSKGKRLVGAEAQMNSDGAIMRLGLLQCADDKETGLQLRGPEAEAPLMHLLSANPVFRSARRLDPPQDYVTGPAAYILSSPSPGAEAATKPIVDMSPHEVVTWYASKVERISFYVSKDGASVLGIRVQFIRRFWEPKRYAGHRDEDEKTDPIEWAEIQMAHLDLCGQEGERVIKIAVSPATYPKALQLTTNRGHQITAGAWDDQDHRSVSLAEGMQFDGIAISWVPKQVDEDQRTILSVIAFASPGED